MMNSESISKAELEQAVRTGACLGRSEFAGSDLTGAMLPNIDLRGSNLAEVNLSNAVVSGGCFRQANMRGANLQGAILRDVGMREVDLREADLRNADLRNAGLQDAKLEGALFQGAQLAGVQFGTATISDGALTGARVGEFLVVGRRPLLTVGPLGPSRHFITAWLTDHGCKLDLAGTLTDIAQFRATVAAESEQDRREYEAVLELIETHSRIWSEPCA